MFDLPEFINNLVDLIVNAKTRGQTISVLVGSLLVGGTLGFHLRRVLLPGISKRELDSANEEIKRLNDQVADFTGENNDLLATNRGSAEEIRKLKATDRELRKSLAQHEALKSALLSDDGRLWSVRKASPPDDFERRLAQSKPRIITIGNLKGGVGKTMLTANLAAYFDQHLEKRVLVIDLDYQGTLTDMFLGAADMHSSGSEVDGFITGQKKALDLIGSKLHLPNVLPNVHLVPAEYELARSENQALVAWLLGEVPTDLRYHLASVLLDPVVQRDYDVVLIDTPPRLGPAMLNALCASHAYFVPTILDKASAQAVAKFVGYVDALLPGLNRGLQFAGVVANFANGLNLTNTEKDARAELDHSLRVQGHVNKIFEDTIRHTVRIHNAAGEKILYSRDRLFREGVMNKIGDEIVRRVPLGQQHEDRSVA